MANDLLIANNLRLSIRTIFIQSVRLMTLFRMKASHVPIEIGTGRFFECLI